MMVISLTVSTPNTKPTMANVTLLFLFYHLSCNCLLGLSALSPRRPSLSNANYSFQDNMSNIVELEIIIHLLSIGEISNHRSSSSFRHPQPARAGSHRCALVITVSVSWWRTRLGGGLLLLPGLFATYCRLNWSDSWG